MSMINPEGIAVDPKHMRALREETVKALAKSMKDRRHARAVRVRAGHAKTRHVVHDPG